MSRVELRVLLVDDDEAVLRDVHRVLMDAGHFVTACASAGQALTAIAGATFDAVVVDRRLRDGTGEAIVDLLSSVQPRLRVVYLSDNHVPAVAGAVVLQKPITADVLLAAIDRRGAS